MDEPSSNLDLHTDMRIMRILTRLRSNEHTVFVIAHRLNTIMHCDRVVVVDAGKHADISTRTTVHKHAHLMNMGTGMGMDNAHIEHLH